jgi:hypothetical protein
MDRNPVIPYLTQGRSRLTSINPDLSCGYVINFIIIIFEMKASASKKGVQFKDPSSKKGPSTQGSNASLPSVKKPVKLEKPVIAKQRTDVMTSIKRS